MTSLRDCFHYEMQLAKCRQAGNIGSICRMYVSRNAVMAVTSVEKAGAQHDREMA
ncbi:MAG TPA: hypothetical protein VGN64_10175 [Dyadobacter sp.]|nr:hypothetical protein [Dyadobacter sp.]